MSTGSCKRPAIDRLPPDLKPFFDRSRPFVVEHSVDPDLRASPVGMKSRRATFSIWTRTVPRPSRNSRATTTVPSSNTAPTNCGSRVSCPGARRKSTIGCVRPSQMPRSELRPTPRRTRSTRCHPQSLRCRRARAVPRNEELRRSADWTARHPRAIRRRALLQISRPFGDRPVVAAAGERPRGFVFDRLSEGLPLATRLLAADRDAAAAHPEVRRCVLRRDVRAGGGHHGRSRLGRNRRHSRDDRGRLGSCWTPCATKRQEAVAPASTPNFQLPTSKSSHMNLGTQLNTLKPLSQMNEARSFLVE